jgi:hypothetical protein
MADVSEMLTALMKTARTCETSVNFHDNIPEDIRHRKRF